MSEEARRKRLGKHSWIEVGEHITDPVELERLAAQRPPDDCGAGIIVGEAVGLITRRQSVGKPASAVPMILGLLELLTPEQQLDLARSLPPMLSEEARALMGEGCRDAGPANGEKSSPLSPTTSSP